MISTCLLLASLVAYDPAIRNEGAGELTKPATVTEKTEAVLLIHGGGWTGMGRNDVRGIADFLRDDLGCVVYNVDYRLANRKNPWPACGDDCVKAAEYMFTDAFAAEAGMKPRRIWIIGGSAGGHLALWTGLKLPGGKVAGVVSISGIADPEVDYPSHPGMYKGLFGGKTVTREMRDSMSVMRLIRPNGPKILLTHTTEDTVVPIATAKSFLAAYRSAGNEIGLFEYPSYIQPRLHGHCIWIPGSKPHRLIPRLEREIAYFMKPPAVPEPKPVPTKFELSALYYPGTEHRAEWDMVEQVRPNWKPLLGWYDESDPENIDWQIKWAVEHGVSSFCVCWYWNRGEQRLDHWVQAFYRAKRRKHLKWYIMCANHNQRGAHSTADQIAVTRFWIDNYLKTPEYFTIDGKPVIVYCIANNLDRDFIDEAKAKGETLQPGEGMRRAMAISEKMAKEAGLPGIHWVNMSWLRSKDEIAFAPTNLDWLRRGGFSARMTYNLGGNTPYDMSPELRTAKDTVRNTDYRLMVAAAEKVAAHAADAPDLPFWPTIPTGYDDTARAFQNAFVTRDISREKFTAACRAVRRACDEKGLRRVMISPINEWQEGSMVEPNRDYGFARYDAIRDAFCEKPPEGWPTNDTPATLGLPLHEFPPLYRHAEQTWEFTSWQEGWYRNPFGAYTVSWKNGAIRFRIVGQYYNIRTRVKPFAAERYGRFRLRMRLAPNPANGPVVGTARPLRLKWGTETAPIIRPDCTVDFTGANVAGTDCFPDGEWREYVIDLSSADGWKGAVNELWLGVENLPQATVEIDWMRFEPAPADSRIGLPVREKVDPRVRTFIEPARIVWMSENSSKSSVTNAEVLLTPRFGQVSEGRFLAPCGCTLENKGEPASILLDFGRELHGGVAIGQGSGRHAKVRVRFGESVSEAMAEKGYKGAMTDHSARDDVHELPWLGTTEIGNTGFRFVRIDLVTPGKASIEAVRAVSLMRPMPYLGSFRSSDARLDRIWATAARTAHLCSQDFLWDGIKRDRLVWMGDMHPEICAVLAAFGAAPVIPESLDYIRATTPAGCAHANNMGTYTYWLVCGLREWWFFTGDLKWLVERHDYLRRTLEFLSVKETKDGYNTVDGLLDWPTHNDLPAEKDGRQGLRVMAFRAGLEMAEALGDAKLARLCRDTLARAAKPKVDPRGQNSAAAVLAIAGLRSPREMYDTVLGKNGIAKFSTFYGYYMLEAMSLAGEDGRALDILRDYWGGMLDMGATSFWEDFDISWTNNAVRVDEMPRPGKKDIHADFGQFCYIGLRHSLCHGWSAGPAAWIPRHILGVERLAPGGRKVRIRPFLGDLEWAEGAVPLACGVLKVRHDRRADGRITTKILERPVGVEIVGVGGSPSCRER